MKINYACDPPPEVLTISGGVFRINTDFRVWLRVSELLQSISSESLENHLAQLYQLIFAEEYPSDVTAAIMAITEFLKGYPEREISGGNSVPTLSLTEDINEIVLAIRNQSGIDLSYRCKHYHWWEFLLEVKTLEDRHYISRIQQIRGYDGSDPKLTRMREKYALQREMTEDEILAALETDELFYDT